MIQKFVFRAAVGAALVGGAFAAQAATVRLNNWAFPGGGGTVHASAPVYNGQAGAFKGTLDGNAFMTYCVELTQTFNWGVSYTNYVDEAASTYFTAPDNKALKLGRLLSYADANNAVTTAAQSTSMQLAIWNIVYDTDLTLSNALHPPFSDTSSYAAYATALLDASKTTTNTMNLWVLRSPTNQDQLHWTRVRAGDRSNITSVPEPTSLALALLGVVAAGGAMRRRRAPAA